MARMEKTYQGFIGPNDHRYVVVKEDFYKGSDWLEDHSYYLPVRETDGKHMHVGDLSWGYGGSGPSRFAMSILSDLYGEAVAKRQWFAFKKEVVSSLPTSDAVEISGAAVEAWMQIHERGAVADLACRCPR